MDSAHALVVIGYDNDSLYVNDPYFDDAPIGEIIWNQQIIKNVNDRL